MRSTQLLALVLFLLLAIPSVSSAHYTQGVGDAFVLVPVEGEDGPSLQDAGLYLVAEVPGGYLAFADDHELAHLTQEGVAAKVLVEEDDKSLEYLIAFDHDHGHALAEPPAEASTLYEGDGYRIMSVPAELLVEQPNCIPEIQRIFRRPLSFVRSPWMDRSLAERGRGTDPDIVQALTAVTQGPLQTQVQALQDFGTRYSTYNGGYLASLWIRDRFLSYGYTDVALESYSSWNDNVVCTKPGTVHPDEVVVIGAHYDSINPSNNNNAPGADDNASGSVAVLEAARVLADIEFERTIVFICFSGEEQGLVGSDAWAQEAASSGTNVVGMINLDMICYRAPGDSEDLDIISNSSSEPLADLVFETIATYVPELAAVDGTLTSGSSDHASFWAHGFRALFFFEDSGSYSPYIHSSQDVVGTSANDFPFMLKNVRAAVATMGVLARPFHVSLAHTPLGNSEGTGPFDVTASIVAAEPLDPSTLELNYRLGGGDFVTLPLLPTGPPNEYGATLPSTGSGGHVEYYLSATDVEGFTATSPDLAPAELHSFRTGVNFAFVEDGETDQGWTLGVPGDDATTGVWIRADPVGTSYQPEDDHTPDPGSICFVTGNANPGDSGGTNDVDGGRTTLLSPVFDLAEATWAGLSYWRWYTDETSHDDDFYVDISNDGGETWTSLEVVDDTEMLWTQVTFDDLAAILPLTDQMRLRFIAEDINDGSLVEALIDDLEVIAIMDDPADVESTVEFVAGIRAYPTPFGPRTSIRYSLPQTGRTMLKIYDATGAEVANLVDGIQDAGSYTTTFDASGLASGAYFARLWLDGRAVATQKLTYVK